MASHKYWVQFVLLVASPLIEGQEEAPPPQELLDVMGVTLKGPITELEHVSAVANLIANAAAEARNAAPGTLMVKILSWVKLEEPSRVYVPGGVN